MSEQKSRATMAATEIISEKIDELKRLKIECASIMENFENEECDIYKQSSLTNYKRILNNFIAKTVYNDECYEYLLNEFIEKSCIALLQREYTLNKEDYNMADQINECLKLLVKISIPLIQKDSKLAMQIIYHCMNSSSSFLKCFGHDWVKYMHHL